MSTIKVLGSQPATTFDATTKKMVDKKTADGQPVHELLIKGENTFGGEKIVSQERLKSLVNLPKGTHTVELEAFAYALNGSKPKISYRVVAVVPAASPASTGSKKYLFTH